MQRSFRRAVHTLLVLDGQNLGEIPVASILPLTYFRFSEGVNLAIDDFLARLVFLSLGNTPYSGEQKTVVR